MRWKDSLIHQDCSCILAHEKTGIDRKHFQPMMELSLSIALRKHLIREATAAFHKSWTSAHKAQEHLNNFIQELYLDKYLDKWIGTSVKAWHQTQENIWRGVLRDYSTSTSCGRLDVGYTRDCF